jgi:threonine/homoserine/homoserine lactone efflux protein
MRPKRTGKPSSASIARFSAQAPTPITHSACRASTSLGIALANAAHIALALAGVSLLARFPLLFAALKWAGCLYLLWLGLFFLRSDSQLTVPSALGTPRERLAPNFVQGFLSGILNPKNSLFYALLFGAIVAPATPAGEQALYGLWMVSAVFAWDAAIARGVGQPRLLAWFQRHLRYIERGSGVVMIVLATAIAWR